jgi:diguanylate cyclase (GGDEF)-like protein
MAEAVGALADGPAPAARTRAGERLLLLATSGLAVATIVWFVLSLDRPLGSRLLGWLPGPIAMVLPAWSAWRLRREPGLPAAARRFWSQIGLAMFMVAVGVAVQGYAVLTGRARSAAPQDVPLLAIAVFAGVIMVALWALLRLPVEARSRGDWIRLALDGATIMLAALLFSWYFAISPLLDSQPGDSSIWGMLVVGVLPLLALGAVIKVLLAGAGPVDPAALRYLGVCVLLGSCAQALTPLIADHPHLASAQVFVPPIAFAATCASARQRHALAQGTVAGTHRRPRRPYSLLPYAAVAATDALLLMVNPVDSRNRVVVATAIVITGLVVVRQVVAFRDNAQLVGTLRQHKELLHHQASHDGLTGLANRSLFGERIETALASRKDNGSLAVLLIDLDDFKTVNDTLGHFVGDGLLVAVADRLRACVRTGDTVARLGGDEFAVLLLDFQPDPATGLAERILAGLSEPFSSHGHNLLVRASIGIAELRPGDHDNPGRVGRHAAIAMFAAKESGKAGYALYTPDMHARLQEQAVLGAQLRDALANGELRLLYQPIVGLPAAGLLGVEALIRWEHPTRGLMLPDDFIPAAERTGLILPLGRWVLREACRQTREWRDSHAGTEALSTSINASARQLQEPGFTGELAATLDEFGLVPRDVVIEVTETAVLKGGQVLRTLNGVHDLGIRLALDDFGTGQSSLGLLRTCPVDILKLDKSFVDGITDTPRQAAVATAIVQMAQAMGMAAIAEGIETQDQAFRLWELGYRIGQGYRFGAPLPAEEIGALVSRADAARAVSL